VNLQIPLRAMVRLDQEVQGVGVSLGAAPEIEVFK
jgi:hypothetical protein